MTVRIERTNSRMMITEGVRYVACDSAKAYSLHFRERFRESWPSEEVARKQFERDADSLGKSPFPAQGGAESGVVGAPVDPHLWRIITFWKSLPHFVKAGILSMITSAEQRVRTS